MNRRSTFLAPIVAAALSFSFGAQAQTAASEGVTIVMPLATKGANVEASVAAMRAVQAVIRKQTGLIDEVLMASKNPSAKPSHVHVMRWKSQDAWEKSLQNPEFNKVVGDNIKVIELTGGASVYLPLK